MSVTIGKYTFDGPFRSTDELEDRPGIYAILCQGRGKSLLIDVGESAKVKMTVGNHGREDCWKKKLSWNACCGSVLCFRFEAG